MTWKSFSKQEYIPEKEKYHKHVRRKIMKKEDKIKVLCVKPEQEPKVIELENTIEAMQEMVGGYVEEIRTFGDPVVLICNEDGKCMGLPLNRMLYDDRSGRPYDILSGTVLIAGIKYFIIMFRK